MVIRSFLTVFFLVAFALLSSPIVSAQTNQDIRFYKANKQLQGNRIILRKKKSKFVGCHNFMKKVRVFQVNQIGYDHCSIFTKKECAAESIIETYRIKQEKPTSKLSEGLSWFPISENPRGVHIRSWNCIAKTKK